MDILTPKGQETRQQEERAIEIWHRAYPSYTYIQTPKDKPALVDAVLNVDGEIRGVVETKCRNMSSEEFKQFGMTWLVTYEKLVKAAVIAEGLCVPLIGFLYLTKDDLLMYQKLWEPDKGWVCEMAIKPTRTQATVNGGSIIRSNAYIDMSNASLIWGN